MSVLDALFPVFIGFALAYAFSPVADVLERRGLSRSTAALLILASVASAAVLALVLIVPPLTQEAADFARHLPQYVGAALDRLSSLGARFGIALPHQRDEVLLRVREALEGLSFSSLSPVGGFAKRFFTGAAGLLVGALNLVLVPVIFFYFVADLRSLRRGVVSLAPPRWQPAAEARFDEADRVFSGYLRGQLSVALILAILHAIGLSLVGIRFGLIIGLLAGLLNIVPYVGVATGLVLALTMAFVDFSGWGPVAGVLAVFGVCQALEGFVITPKIVGDKVGLSPLETIIALIIGGQAAGFPGLILAIPTAGCLKVYVKDTAAVYRRSSWYTR